MRRIRGIVVYWDPWVKRERLLHGDPATFAGQIHIDLIIGSPALDVDGITRDGEHVPLLRRGAWQL